MIRQLGYALILACGLNGLPSAAEELLQLDAGPNGGKVEYVNPATLEIGIGGKLFKLGSDFEIQGLPGEDRLQQLGELRQGMRVEYESSGSSPGYEGVIRELRVQPD